MLEQGGGSIVNTSSAGGLVGLRGNSAYAASKHGIVGLTKTAALEYAQEGIRVNTVCPGGVDTPMIAHVLSDPERRQRMESSHPVGRVARPEEIADAVIWLSSDTASFVTGVALPVDGGWIL